MEEVPSAFDAHFHAGLAEAAGLSTVAAFLCYLISGLGTLIKRDLISWRHISAHIAIRSLLPQHTTLDRISYMGQKNKW